MRIALLLILATSVGCPSAADETPPGTPKALVIGLDGVRGDGVATANTPEMDRLMDEGAWTLDGSTQMTGPTVSGPGWTSILTGFEVIDHGIVTNDGWDNRVAGTPTWLLRAREQGIETVAAIHWVPILTGLIEEDALSDQRLGTDDEVADQMADFIRAGAHAFHFVHLDDVDGAGHSTGFSPENPDYIEAIEAQDERIGRMLRAVESRPDDESWLVAITTDHGGSGTSHGGLDADNRTIPVLFHGPEWTSGELDGDGAITHMDPMTTAAAHVGVTINDGWGHSGNVIAP
jgi:predicted AlkP superfamily pyrophosphatase or phosphodiesterase